MKENVEQRLTGESKGEFDEFKKFMNNSQGVKDFAKRKIRLIQDLIHNYKAEDMKQNVLHVAKVNRGKISSHPSKSELKLV